MWTSVSAARWARLLSVRAVDEVRGIFTMRSDKKKLVQRKRRQRRVFFKLRSVSDRPRLRVFRSARHFYGQIIDDRERRTLVSCSTVEKDFPRDAFKSTGNIKAAEKVGEIIAERAVKKGITEVVFDRSFYRYHGRVKAFAEAARKGGLKF